MMSKLPTLSLGLSLVAVVSLSGCAARSDTSSHYTSVDIPTRWMPTDTLCIPIETSAEPQVGDLITGMPYDCAVGVRYESTFPYRELALCVEMRYTDDLGCEHLVQRGTLEVALTDAAGAWQGGSWGSLIQREKPERVPMTFPYDGSYRLLLWPAYGDSVALQGLTNLTLEWRAKQ
jgi:gliding motility-associated lipoprotein GldH